MEGVIGGNSNWEQGTKKCAEGAGEGESLAIVTREVGNWIGSREKGNGKTKLYYDSGGSKPKYTRQQHKRRNICMEAQKDSEEHASVDFPRRYTIP